MIAFVTDSTQASMSSSDTCIANALTKRGYTVVAAPWDNPTIRWDTFDAIVIRSCWNYHEYYESFLTWLSHIQQLQKPIYNAPETIRWNTHKSYIRDLANKGISTIPTVLIPKNTLSTLPYIISSYDWADLVVKPCIGAMSRGVFRIKKSDAHTLPVEAIHQNQTTDYLVQRYVPEIADGECSMVFIHNTFTHAVLKKPKKNDFRAHPMFGSRERVYRPSHQLIQFATDVLIKAQLDTLYARVDCIIGKNGFLLMELEVTEPYLFIEYYPPAAELFADELERRLRMV